MRLRLTSGKGRRCCQMQLEEARGCRQKIVGRYNTHKLIVIDHWETANLGLPHDFNRFQGGCC